MLAGTGGFGDGIDDPHCVEVHDHAEDAYQVGSRWGSTASGSTGGTGSGITLTYSIVPDGTTLTSGAGEPNATSNFITRMNAIYAGGSATWLPIVAQAFASWSNVTGITYIYQPTDDGVPMTSGNNGVLGVRGDVRIGSHPIDGGSGILAYNYFPNFGDMTIDSNDLTSGGYMFNTSTNSKRLRNVLAHEHGHGIGLNHVDPVNETKLMEPFVSTLFDMVQFDDMLAGNRSYGDVNEKGTGNNTAGNATNRGVLAVGTDLLTNRSLSTTGDVDFFKFTLAANQNTTITLTPTGSTYFQGAQNGSTSSFNATAQMNLQVELLAANGTTVLATGNSNAAGIPETINATNLALGDYYIRVKSASGASNSFAQMYSLSTAITTPTLNGNWTGLGDGFTWRQASNWSNNLIPGVSDDVIINVPANPTILMDQSESVKSVTSSEMINITASGTLTIANSSVFNTVVSFAGALSGAGDATFNSSLTWTGGTFSGTGAIVIGDSGNLTVTGSGVRSSTRPLQINGSASLAAGTGEILVANSLTLGATASFDLNDNKLIVDYSDASPASSLQANLGTGYNAGAWNGTGIRSSTAAANPGDGIGIAEATQVDASVLATFGGVSIDSTAVLFQYTVIGDADFNLASNSQDFNLLAENFNLSSKLFSDGDFSHDGIVDSVDFNLYLGQYGRKLPAPAPSLAMSAGASPFASASSLSEKDERQDLLV